jgi:hypothetical protein
MVVTVVISYFNLFIHKASVWPNPACMFMMCVAKMFFLFSPPPPPPKTRPLYRIGNRHCQNGILEPGFYKWSVRHMFCSPALSACCCRHFICVTSSHTLASCGGRDGEGVFTVSPYAVSATPSEIAFLLSSYRSTLHKPLSYCSCRPVCLQHQRTKSVTNGT